MIDREKERPVEELKSAFNEGMILIDQLSKDGPRRVSQPDEPNLLMAVMKLNTNSPVQFFEVQFQSEEGWFEINHLDTERGVYRIERRTPVIHKIKTFSLGDIEVGREYKTEYYEPKTEWRPGSFGYQNYLNERRAETLLLFKKLKNLGVTTNSDSSKSGATPVEAPASV